MLWPVAQRLGIVGGARLLAEGAVEEGVWLAVGGEHLLNPAPQAFVLSASLVERRGPLAGRQLGYLLEDFPDLLPTLAAHAFSCCI